VRHIRHRDPPSLASRLVACFSPISSLPLKKCSVSAFDLLLLDATSGGMSAHDIYLAHAMLHRGVHKASHLSAAPHHNLVVMALQYKRYQTATAHGMDSKKLSYALASVLII